MDAKKAVGYTRVSTTGQADEGVSLEAQEAKIRAYCDLNDLDLTGIFTDAGISGKRADNRPALQEALIACGLGAVLVVYSLSRLARSTRDTINLAERLEKSGSDLVSLSEKIDTTSASGKMIFRILAVLAEFERDQIAERTRLALSHKKSRGERVGQIPYGWKVLEDGKKLAKDEYEQSIIKAMQKYRKQRMSLRKISAQLAAEGILARCGKPFAPFTIDMILRK